MKCKKSKIQSFNPVAYASALLLFIVGILMAPVAMALTVTVTGVTSTSPLNEVPATSPVANYRWLVEEDKTYHVPLTAAGEVELDGAGVPVIDPNWRVGDPNRNTVSVSFHHSYMPVVMT
ncbi:MAG: hypothetical protein QNL87_01235, partial [Gammaproteobacteria bacterium]|nr:hypothetical protein [Gammaproteobacteria bacterium]